MEAYGTGWTRRGWYNYACYAPGERAEALDGSPVVQTSYVVLWYPGKPTIGVCGRRDDPLEYVRLLDAMQARPVALRTVYQEPIAGGAWWLRYRDGLAGPYTYRQLFSA